ncbi:DinB family protein [Lacihabitans sp. LS3-19]|uniref:DinB family protein n=1 Tax=Lacihabitans sp. LS3-19 TaxID=2487335 RepID=UPI0020CEE856|nr:DinB family protein [Lacihabitans sp. LS3-19]MCP9770127.1 DinB family protein [Lacihabitans sp. LS3-19]
MTRNSIGELPEFFDRYILLNDENLDLCEGLEKFSPQRIFSDVEKYNLLGERVYALGKWTVKDILQHCIDTERIMAYRAMSFARNENQLLPGFDENRYAENTNLENRSIESLLEEFSILRKSTIFLFENMDKPMLLRKGQANSQKISSLSLGFVIIGHAMHHEKVLRERYYPILLQTLEYGK